MYNREAVTKALQDFNKKKPDAIPDILEGFIKTVAKSGQTTLPWPKIKSLFIEKTDKAMNNFENTVSMESIAACPNVENVTFEEMRQRILKRLNELSGVPFTIQRLAELITDPRKHYKRTDKFLRGIEKNVNVVSTVDVYGNKIITEPMEMNGEDGDNLGSPDMNASLFVPPPPVNSPVTMGAVRMGTFSNANGVSSVQVNANSLFKEESKDESNREAIPAVQPSTSTSEAEAKQQNVEENCNVTSDQADIINVENTVNTSKDLDSNISSQIEADSQDKVANSGIISNEAEKQDDNEAEQMHDTSKREAVSKGEEEPPEKRLKQEEFQQASSSSPNKVDASSSESISLTGEVNTDDSTTPTTSEQTQVTSSDQTSSSKNSEPQVETSSEAQIATQSESEATASELPDSKSETGSGDGEIVTLEKKDTSPVPCSSSASSLTLSASSTTSSALSSTNIIPTVATSDVTTSTDTADEEKQQQNKDEECAVTSETTASEDKSTVITTKAEDQSGESAECKSSVNQDNEAEQCQNENEKKVEDKELFASEETEQEPMDTD